jgi:alpha-galactosidase/6-phospho-beta-glucosidase family protein
MAPYGSTKAARHAQRKAQNETKHKRNANVNDRKGHRIKSRKVEENKREKKREERTRKRKKKSYRCGRQLLPYVEPRQSVQASWVLRAIVQGECVRPACCVSRGRVSSLNNWGQVYCSIGGSFIR